MLIALDYETNGLEYYRSDFEVISCAFSWLTDKGEIKSLYVEGQEAVGNKVKSIIEKGFDILVFNYQFEYSVTKYIYGLDLPCYADVQRLVQYYGPCQSHERLSFGLAGSVERILNIANYKEKYHNWIRENIKIPKNVNPGRFISKLPPDLLEEYNKADTEMTLRLYQFLVERFKKERYDWKPDHDIYCNMVKLFSQAKAKGIKVNYKELSDYRAKVEKEIEDTDSSFLRYHKDGIEKLMLNRFTAKLNSYKSARAKENYTWAKFKASPLAEFNVASSTQLAELIVNTYGKEVKVWSHYNDDGSPKDGARPSFSSKTLSKWGEDVKLLVKRSKRKKVKEFCDSLVKKVETSESGRWHQDLKAVGTITGRFAGGGNLNVQGIPRRDKGFMGSLEADEGKVFVSIDCVAGEPTITSEYTRDKHYTLINSGKTFEPYWNAEGFLVIDDIYLAGMSHNPVLKPYLVEAWNAKYNGKSFVEQWMEDKEVIKDSIKTWRQIAKAQVLGLGYGMQPKKLRFSLQSNGLKCSYDDARDTYDNYWKFFSGIKRFIKAIEQQNKKQGFLINEFGFRSSPEIRKSYNWMIQSTINPLICIFTLKLLELAHYAEYVVLIHDETVFQIPEDKVEDFKMLAKKSEDYLNSLINWSIKVRTGYAVGKNMYEAK